MAISRVRSFITLSKCKSTSMSSSSQFSLLRRFSTRVSSLFEVDHVYNGPNGLLHDNWEFQTPVMLDAPVSGGVLAAEAGTLTFMVSGSEEAYLAAKPLFLSMGKSTVYCGGAGNGSGGATKIPLNFVLNIHVVPMST